MAPPIYKGTAAGTTPSKNRTTSLTVTASIPSGTNFLIAHVQSTTGPVGGNYPSMMVGGQVGAVRYQNTRGGNMKYQIIYKVNPPTGTQNIVFSTNAVVAMAVTIAFFSGVDTASPFAGDTAAAYNDIYVSSALSIASDPDWYLFSAADQNRWQAWSYVEGSPSSGWANLGARQGYAWNNDSDDPKTWQCQSMAAHRAGAAGSQSIQWSYPHLGSPLVYLCAIRGMVAAKGTSQSIFFL